MPLNLFTFSALIFVFTYIARLPLLAYTSTLSSIGTEKTNQAILPSTAKIVYPRFEKPVARMSC